MFRRLGDLLEVFLHLLLVRVEAEEAFLSNQVEQTEEEKELTSSAWKVGFLFSPWCLKKYTKAVWRCSYAHPNRAKHPL